MKMKTFKQMISDSQITLKSFKKQNENKLIKRLKISV